jgi:ubiquinol-cytochrome c reductase cytochrome b subunit
LVIDVLILGWAGGSAATPIRVAISQLAAAYYFAHFLIILPLISAFERPLPLPDSISSSRLHGEQKEAAPAGISPRRGATATAE